MKKQEPHNITTDPRQVSAKPTILSPQSEVMYEIGKKMMIDSLEISRQFAQFMVTTTISSIPTYLALLGIIGFDPKTATISQKLMALIPIPFLLLSFYLFILAYFPKQIRVSLDVIENIKEAHSATLNKRKKLLIWALAVYTLAIILSLIILVFLS